MDSLFSANLTSQQPLAERLRPQTLDTFIGQEQLVGKTGPIRRMLEQDKLVSMIFWGPPGSGKTTLAHIIAQQTKAKFVTISAVTSGVKDLREITSQAQSDKELHALRTIVFVDEIHRWNKAQQDSLLPFIEKGIITLIGATTEKPSFELNSALLSRCQVFVFERLTSTDLHKIVVGLVETRLIAALPADVTSVIVSMSDGDARILLNTIELLQQHFTDLGKLTVSEVKAVLQKVALRYDKSGEEHYNLISALHKTMRASDVNGALYWAGRMLFAGEDPLYVMRRVVEFAAEDIGLADPQALQLCVAAYQSVHFLGMPEGQYSIFEAVAYCARAKKSRAVYNAAQAVTQDIKTTENAPVPMHLRNLPSRQAGAPTKLMKEVGYGTDQGQGNLPEQLKDREYWNL